VTLLDPVAGTCAEVSGPRTSTGWWPSSRRTTGDASSRVRGERSSTAHRGVDHAFYIGVGNVEESTATRAAERKDLFIQIWIEIGEKRRKLVFEYPLRPGSPQFTASITEWSFEAPKPELFVAKIPEGVGKVDFLPLEGGR
jgi:hypothetical protein